MVLCSRILICALVISTAFVVTTPLQAADRVDLGLITVRTNKEARNLRVRLLKGESFEALAKKYSIGAAGHRGGRLGRVPIKKLRVEFREALLKLKPGQPSPVIPTEHGFALIMSFGKVEKAVPPVAKSMPEPPLKISPLVFKNYLAGRRQVMAGAEHLAGGDFKAAGLAISKALGFNPLEDAAFFFLQMIREAEAGKVKAKAVQSFALGFLNMIDGDVRASLKEYSKANQTDPGFWQAVLFEANLLAEMGQAQKARKRLARVLVLKPDSVRAFISLGNLARDEGDFEKARRYFIKAIEANPRLADAHYQLGAMDLYQRKWKEAEVSLKKALTLDPFKEEAYNDLGLVFANTGRLDQASANYLKTLEISPQFAPAHINLGSLYVRQRKLNKAIDEFEKALSVHPGLGDAHTNLASVYILKRDWGRAILHADKALALNYPVPQPILRALEPHRGQP